MTFSSYPKYNETDLEWIGNIPHHWQFQKPKWFFVKMNRPIRETDEVITCFRDGVVTLRKNRRLRGFTESIKEIGYQGIRKGDLVIHAMDAFAGAVGVSDSNGKGSPVYSVCQPKHTANPYYYSYLIKEMSRSGWIQALAKGIRERSTDFRFDDFSNQKVPVPGIDEQEKIVNYLAWTNSKITSYIQLKRKLINYLEEYKNTVIHNAVTGVINPLNGMAYPNYKITNLIWANKIPEHWNLSPLGGILIDRKEKNDPIKTTDILSLSLKDGVLPYSDKKSGGNKAKDDLSKYNLAYPDDIVVNSMNVVVGSVGLSRYFGAVSPVYYVLTKRNPSDNINYFNYLFLDKAFQRSLFGLGNGIMYIKSRSTGKLNTIRLRIPLTKLKRLYIPLPEPKIQNEIVQYIEQNVKKVNILIKNINEELTLLSEYKLSMISNCVLGKIEIKKNLNIQNLNNYLHQGNITSEVESDEEIESNEVIDDIQIDENESN